MATRTVIITGGSSGLGLETAKIIAKSPGWHLVLAVRDVTRGAEVSKSLAPCSVLPLDLASLASVRAFPALLEAAKVPPLHVVICNAGTQDVGQPKKTIDGFEETFAVNHLAHFLLTQLLLPKIAEHGRIVFVSSGTHDPKQKSGMPDPRFASAHAMANDLEPGAEAGKRRYTTSKLCNVLTAYELDRQFKAQHRSVSVNAIDPGMMPGTGLARSYSAIERFAWRFVLPVLRAVHPNVNSVALSAKRLAEVALSQTAQSGQYFAEGRVIRSSDESYDETKAHELWQGSLALVGLT